MAVSKMKLISIIGHKKYLDSAIFACGTTGSTQPDDSLTFFSDTGKFKSIHEENPYQDPIAKLEAAAARIGGELEPDPEEDPALVTVKPAQIALKPAQMALKRKKKTASQRMAAMSEYAAVLDGKDELVRYAGDFSASVAGLTAKRDALLAEVDTLSKDCEQYEHFLGLDIELGDILSCTMIKVRFGRLPCESYDKLALYDANPYVLFFPGTKDSDYYWGVYFAPLDHSLEVDRVFSSLYFERLRIPAAVGTPQEIIEHLHTKRWEARDKITRIDEQLQEYWRTQQEKCRSVYAQLKKLSYFFSARRYAAWYNDCFILTGWIPAGEEASFRAALDQVEGVEYKVEEAQNDNHHTPPIKLKNPWLFRPFEYFVGMYGFPRYLEMDPSIFIGLTYTLLFGVMFGDLGQGLVLVLAGALMWKRKKMPIGRILIPCGLSSAAFGVLFGSVFGYEHLLDPLYKALFGLHEKPIEVMNPSMTSTILVSAAALGAVLILVAMSLNIYSGLKQKNYESALFGQNGLAGFVFYASLVCGLTSKVIGRSIMSPLYVVCLIILPLIFMFLGEPLGKLVSREKAWQPQKWGEYCTQSFFELFEGMLAYLSNTMSFLRVGAFVLVHAGMMMAVFTLAELTGGAASVAVVIVGNIVVMGMEALLVAIQVMRLEFYEMFSRYYKGDGRAFKPLSDAASEKVFSAEE